MCQLYGADNSLFYCYFDSRSDRSSGLYRVFPNFYSLIFSTTTFCQTKFHSIQSRTFSLSATQCNLLPQSKFLCRFAAMCVICFLLNIFRLTAAKRIVQPVDGSDGTSTPSPKQSLLCDVPGSVYFIAW